MLRDGSEPRSSDAGNRARGTVVPSSDVPEKERLRLVDAFLFCDLGLSETLVRSECVFPKCSIEVLAASFFFALNVTSEQFAAQVEDVNIR